MSFFDTENQHPLWLSDYAMYIEGIIDHLRAVGNAKITVVGHSFGGRVGIRIAARGKIDKLVLIDSAGIKPRKTMRQVARRAKYRLAKAFNRGTSKCGSPDYQALSVNMKRTFVNIISTFQDHELKLIAAPTLIIWGEKDHDTPMYMAKKLNKVIANSGLYIIKGAGHYSYLDKPKEFLSGVNAFLCDN